jgi:hypothetical protein
MHVLRSARWLLLALLVCLIPAAAHAGVLIQVGFAPPALPVYEQPLCPEPGLMWTPGYWAYGDDGYYWVPGAWVAAPYAGALWTPGYWGWEGGRYFFHGGYWGLHVGYYGGVNYGFGYGGIGFAGGMWRGGIFSYNTAVMHVGVGGGWGGRVFVDRGIVERGYVARDSHVAFAGGPGGIRHEPSPEERIAEHEQHRGPSDAQMHHAEAARADRTSYAKNNGGHPAHGGVERPMGGGAHGAENHAAAGHAGGAVGGHAGGTTGGAHGTVGGTSHTASSTTTHTTTSTTTHTASTHTTMAATSHTASSGGSSSHGASSGGGSHASSGGGSHAGGGGGSAPKGGGGGGHHK